VTELHETFSDDFKALWEPESQMQAIWENIEVLYQGIKDFAQEQAILQLGYRPLPEIESDMASKSKPMEFLYLETIRLLWTKILLRTLLKVIDGMQLVFYSANTRNAYGCALGARSVLEHIALLQYFGNQAPWLTQSMVDLQAAIPFTKALFNLGLGSRFNWDELLKGNIRQMVSRGDWERPKDERIPAIAQLIEGLETALQNEGKLQYKNELKFLYGVLCDVVHPSWGGDFIYAPNMYREMQPSRENIERFKVSAVMFCGSLHGLMAHLVRLHERLTERMPDLILREHK